MPLEPSSEPSPPESPPTRRPVPRVVYIAGYGRSGSTVLDLLLGASDSCSALGELFMFHRPDELTRCSCGGDLSPNASAETTCPYWRQVRSQFPPPDDPDEGASFRRHVEGFWAPFFHPSWTASGRRWRQTYALRQQALLSAAAHAAGVSVVVDSSKTAVEVAWRPWALHRWAGAEVKVVHLVRDGRGVMWSALRGCNRKLEQGALNAGLPWPRLRSVLGWIQANLAAELHRWLLPSGSVLFLRYETLVASPEASLVQLSTFTGLDLSTVSSRLSQGLPIPPGHSLSGNRLRSQGIGRLTLDDEWQGRLSLASRLLYFLPAWPFHLYFIHLRGR